MDHVTLAMFPSVYFYVHFGILHKKNDGNTKMHILLKMCLKNVGVNWIIFIR